MAMGAFENSAPHCNKMALQTLMPSRPSSHPSTHSSTPSMHPSTQTIIAPMHPIHKTETSYMQYTYYQYTPQSG